MYDSYYTYHCIECGEIIETNYKMKNVIDCNISYNILNKEYFELLFKFDEIKAIDIMLEKYKKHLDEKVLKL